MVCSYYSTVAVCNFNAFIFIFLMNIDYMNIIPQNFVKTTLLLHRTHLLHSPHLLGCMGLHWQQERGCWQNFVGKSLLAKTNWQKVQISLIFLESVI